MTCDICGEELTDKISVAVDENWLPVAVLCRQCATQARDIVARAESIGDQAAQAIEALATGSG